MRRNEPTYCQTSKEVQGQDEERHDKRSADTPQRGWFSSPTIVTTGASNDHDANAEGLRETETTTPKTKDVPTTGSIEKQKPSRWFDNKEVDSDQDSVTTTSITTTSSSESSFDDADADGIDLYSRVDSVMKKKESKKASVNTWWRLFSPEPDVSAKEEEGAFKSELVKWRSQKRKKGDPQDDEDVPKSVVASTEQNNDPLEKYMHQTWTVARQATVAVAGGALVTVGIPLIFVPIPGTGVATIFGGLYLLSTEFEAAKNVLEPTKEWIAEVTRQMETLGKNVLSSNETGSVLKDKID